MPPRIDPVLKKITDKFYRTEEERQTLLDTFRPHMESMMNSMGNYIHELLNRQIKFQVFFMNFNDIPTIHAGLSTCCGNEQDKVSSQIRLELEQKILTSTKFRKIVWEL